MMEKREHINDLWKKAVDEYKENVSGKEYARKECPCYLQWNGKVPCIRFEAFDDFDFINASFSTRFGGVSSGYLGELNLGFNRGDSLEIVEKNYRVYCKSVGIEPENLVLSDQIHETEIKNVDKNDCCNDKIVRKLVGIDGLCTNKENICLATSYADCVPIFFADVKKRAIASSHSGWRGTVGKIGTKTIEKMKQDFGSNPEDIVVVVGPSICQDCYEVSEDVIREFNNNFSEDDIKNIVKPKKQEGKYSLDLWGAIYYSLKEAGVKPDNIYVSGLCTCNNSKLFFSHRASNGKRGNLNGFISLSF